MPKGKKRAKAATPIPGVQAKKGKQAKKRPLCNQRRFLLLFFGQALLICIYLSPPLLGEPGSRGIVTFHRNSDDKAEGASSATSKSGEKDTTGGSLRTESHILSQIGDEIVESLFQGNTSLSTHRLERLEETNANKELQRRHRRFDSISRMQLSGRGQKGLNAFQVKHLQFLLASAQLHRDIVNASKEEKRQKMHEMRVLLAGEGREALAQWAQSHVWPPRSETSSVLQRLNWVPPRNAAKYPRLAPDRVIIVLYVHRRPHFLKKCLQGLSKVHGINETLLIISHDGRYQEMDQLVQTVSFCRVKQIYAPFSPHSFNGYFPGPSSRDCRGKQAAYAAPPSCEGQADHYGNFRSPNSTAIKHHWWWMMNTVWDGLAETRGFNGHMLFLEEDIYVMPAAYQHIKTLVDIKNERCSSCIAANLSPARANFYGDSSKRFVKDLMGNIGYTFNRSIWESIKRQALDFCFFDDYNWDSTLSTAVLASWPHVDSLRWSRTSAIHFGSCGTHIRMSLRGSEGFTPQMDCSKADLSWLDKIQKSISFSDDLREHLNASIIQWKVERPDGLFEGWGGWGDFRDHGLCELFTHRDKRGLFS